LLSFGGIIMLTNEKKISSASEYFINTPSETAKQLFFYPTVIGKFDYQKGYHLSRNHFDSYLLLFIEKGNMEIMLNDKAYTATAGDIVFIDCYEPHQYSSHTDCETLWLHFDGASARAYFDYIKKLSAPVITSGSFNLLYQQLYTLYNCFKSSNIPSEPELSLSILTLLHKIILSLESKAPVSDAVQKAAAFISANFKNKISIDAISSEAGFSPYYFIRVFKKEIGMTPHQYLLSTRIAAARYSLSTTRMSISEIATSCGFDDDSAFCYAFRKWENMTPTEYRNTQGIRM